MRQFSWSSPFFFPRLVYHVIPKNEQLFKCGHMFLGRLGLADRSLIFSHSLIIFIIKYEGRGGLLFRFSLDKQTCNLRL